MQCCPLFLNPMSDLMITLSCPGVPMSIFMGFSFGLFIVRHAVLVHSGFVHWIEPEKHQHLLHHPYKRKVSSTSTSDHKDPHHLWYRYTRNTTSSLKHASRCDVGMVMTNANTSSMNVLKAWWRTQVADYKKTQLTEIKLKPTGRQWSLVFSQ